MATKARVKFGNRRASKSDGTSSATPGAIGFPRLLMSQAFTDLAQLVPVGARTVIVHGVASSTRREVAALLPEASIHDLSDISGSDISGSGVSGSDISGSGVSGSGVSGSGVSGSGPPGPSQPGPGAVRADLVVMEVGSHVGQARIAAEFLELAGHMREGAVLLVVTARRRGSARQLKTLDRMFGAAEVAQRSGSAVVLRAVRGPVVRAAAAATAAAPTVEAALLGRDLRFETGVGLFSKSRIDNGTRLLLEALPREHGWRDVLDLGCGYGPIGIAVASRWPQVRVVMADIDPLAVTAARTNAQTNGVDDRCEVCVSDGTAALTGRCFDAVLSHLPTHVPRSTLHRLIGESQSVLRPGGELIAVTASAVDLRDRLGSDFDTVRVMAESRAGTSPRYRVVQAVDAGPAGPR